jgi:hypothetical protein
MLHYLWLPCFCGLPNTPLTSEIAPTELTQVKISKITNNLNLKTQTVT